MTGRKITKLENIKQMDLLKQLDESEIQLFTINSIKHIFPKVKNLNMVVENLVRNGFLHRLERGKYCRSTFQDENVIGTFLAKNGTVAYWSALNLHGLTTQFSNTTFIQTTQQRNQAAIFETKYQFVKINSNKRTGIIHNGYGNYKYAITDLEKTIVDCFDLPQHSGGYAELIRAFYHVKLDAQKLIDYCSIVNNRAVTKRLGYLAELFNKKNLKSFVSYARTQVNRTYNLFDPLGDYSGEPESSWCLRLNLSKEDILNIAQNPY